MKTDWPVNHHTNVERADIQALEHALKFRCGVENVSVRVDPFHLGPGGVQLPASWSSGSRELE